MKKSVQIIGALILIVILILSILTYWQVSVRGTTKESRLVYSSVSPDKKHEIKIFAYGWPLFFDSQEIGIQIGRYGDTIFSKVGNDGARIGEDNFDVTWNNNIATVTVSGKEQYPATYEITFYPQWNNYSIVKIQD